MNVDADLLKALIEIADGAPKEEPKTEHGDVLAAQAWTHWQLATIAREAIAKWEGSK